MKNTKNVKRSFYINISLLVVTVVSILLTTIFLIMFYSIKSIYIENFQKQTVGANTFISSQINGDKIEEYSKSFIKDNYYYELNSMLYMLKETFQIKYMYILVDLGDPDTYTYIFDAIYDEETHTYDDSNYGATDEKSVFPEGAQVLKTGLPFKEAAYSATSEYGRLFYAYSPITNSKGDVVAFLGTDISADHMFERINRVALFLCVFGLLSFIVIYMIVMLYCRNYISKPIVKLSLDVTSFSEGELNIEIPDKLLKRKDELGLIYQSFSNVISTIGNLIKELNDATEDVIKGRIDSRIHYENHYRGSYENIAKSIDLLLDNARKSFNLMPVYFSIYEYNFTPLYRNTPAISFTDIEPNGNLPKNEITCHAHDEALRESFFAFTESEEESYTGSFSINLNDDITRHYNYFLIKNNPRSDIKNICCVLTDVTDYVEMSEKAFASSKAKGEFLSKMSHEIRTPMNAIIGMTEVSKRQTDITKIKDNLESIQTSSAHLLTVINDILDISKIESGKMEIVHIKFDLNQVIHDTASIAEKFSMDKNIDLKIDLDNPIHSSLLFWGDEVRLKQILINLLSNAVKFSPKNSEVHLSLRLEQSEPPDQTKLYFSVKDNGIGIKPENLSTIFEAFEQASSEITRNFGGTGLGLPICNTLVQLMGGDAIAVSSEPGKGSEFSFSLELDNADVLNDNETVPVQNIDFSGKRLLLVDDIEINRVIVISLLEDSGIEIDCCDDGSTAVEKFIEMPEHYYDLIFMDIQMKIMDGYTASCKIRDSNRKDSSTVKIIAMSANAFQSDIDAAGIAGMDDYIVKPIDYNTMINKMKVYLKK